VSLTLIAADDGDDESRFITLQVLLENDKIATLTCKTESYSRRLAVRTEL